MRALPRQDIIDSITFAKQQAANLRAATSAHSFGGESPTEGTPGLPWPWAARADGTVQAANGEVVAQCADAKQAASLVFDMEPVLWRLAEDMAEPSLAELQTPNAFAVRDARLVMRGSG